MADQSMDFSDSFYASQQPLSQPIINRPNFVENTTQPLQFLPSTSTMFYQPSNRMPAYTGARQMYANSLAPPQLCGMSTDPGINSYPISKPYIMMTPSPAASCESSLYSIGCTSPARMPIRMSAHSPGVYSPLSDSTAPSPFSHASASRTASFNSAGPNSVPHKAADYLDGNGSSMDAGSSAIQQTFIQHHNFSVEVYQNFKANVNLLFNANTPIQQKNQIISSILEIVNMNLITAIETEKDYLMNDVLCPWAICQQKYSIASLWTQQMHYNQLNVIDTQFEYFGELLEQTLNGLHYLTEHFPKLGFEEAFGRMRQLTHLFLFYSVVVARQPPAVVVKCGEAENHRRSRFWFNTELRILGGRTFGLHQSAENLQVKCYLITDETAKKLRGNAYYEINENEHFVIEPSVECFQTLANDTSVAEGTGEAFVAKFDDMRVSKKEQLRREEVWKKRYNLCYNIRIPTNSKYNIELVGKKVSLPFAILVGPKCDVEAKLFLERSFSDFMRRPDRDLPNSVHYNKMIAALEMKFQAIIETPQKSTDQPAAVMPRPFLAQSRQHLVNRLKPDADGQVLLDNFLKMPVAEEYCVKRSVGSINSGASLTTGAGNLSTASVNSASDSGEWKLVPFFEWFFKLAELVNKNFVQLWNDGFIFGFCGKEDAEQLLAECHSPTLLIRFSDYEFAKVKISVRDVNGVIRHHWYETQDLIGRSLNEELFHNVKYRDVKFIYPNTSLEAALGSRRLSNASSAERARKPRNLQPSPIYFNNQEPAVRLN